MELIVNVTENWAIGFENSLLVTISADLRRFRELTTGKTVILGRKTLATFPGGRPLKNRINLVLTHDEGFSCEGAVAVHSEKELFEKLRELPQDSVCVIGGASVYEALLDYCDKARITKTYVNLKADRFFPNLDEKENWEATEKSEILEENGIRFQYIDYVNKTPKKFPIANKD